LHPKREYKKESVRRRREETERLRRCSPRKASKEGKFEIDPDLKRWEKPRTDIRKSIVKGGKVTKPTSRLMVEVRFVGKNQFV